MKLRTPDSFEHAITVLLADLGDEACARIIGKSASLIRKAADPDQDFMLNLHQALMLERAYKDKHGTMPPILRVLMRELVGDNIYVPIQGNVVTHALLLQKEVGECSEKVREFTAAHSTGGETITPNEATVLLHELDDIERAAAAAKVVVKNQLSGKDQQNG